MKLTSYFKMLFDGRAIGFSLFILNSIGFFRIVFISAGLESGVYSRLAKGHASLADLAEILGPKTDKDKLEVWLRLGVKLGELGLNRRGYYLRGYFSKSVVRPKNDSVAALVIEIVHVYHGIVTKTPEMLARNQEFGEWTEYGELIARSSRTIEEGISPNLDDVIPKTGTFRMLEVGCGSGIYMKYACNRNPDLIAAGLELQEQVAGFAEKNIQDWGIHDRATVQAINVWDYKTEVLFDLVTLHNNIYYFPLESRIDLAGHLLNFLKPGGRLVITSGCQGGRASVEYMNLFCVMTKGYGPLPDPDQLEAQLISAGFESVDRRLVIPKIIDSVCMFIARKPL